MLIKNWDNLVVVLTKVLDILNFITDAVNDLIDAFTQSKFGQYVGKALSAATNLAISGYKPALIP